MQDEGKGREGRGMKERKVKGSEGKGRERKGREGSGRGVKGGSEDVKGLLSLQLSFCVMEISTRRLYLNLPQYLR